VVEYHGSDPMLKGERYVVPDGLTLFGLHRFIQEQIDPHALRPIEWVLRVSEATA
jgi:hypothetical protein